MSAKQKRLDKLEKELQGIIVTFANASSSNVYNKDCVQKKIPVASLIIPNNLYKLWSEKVKLCKALGIDVPSHTEMLNERIGGTTKANAADQRLRRESCR